MAKSLDLSAQASVSITGYGEGAKPNILEMLDKPS